MHAEVTPHTITEIAQNHEAALAWVQARGFRVDQGRHADYRRTLNSLLQQWPMRGWGDFSDDAYRERVCTALLESRELVSFYRGLSDISDPAAVDNLRHYIKGPALPTQELAATASNRARNFGFELYLNALFAYAGLQPEYSTKADLSVCVDGLRIFVEAKRPMSASAVEGSVERAIDQLAVRLRDDVTTERAGIVAVDLSKVINQGNSVMPVRDEAHLHALMYAEDKIQMGMLMPVLLKKLRPGVVGLLLHYRIVSAFESTGGINTVKWIGWVPFLEEPRLLKLHKELESVVRLIC